MTQPTLQNLLKINSQHFAQDEVQCGVFPGGIMIENLPPIEGNAGDTGLIPELRRSSGEGNGNPLWYSCLKNPMDGGAW